MLDTTNKKYSLKLYIRGVVFNFQYGSQTEDINRNPLLRLVQFSDV
jgi:hypothetical protein